MLEFETCNGYLSTLLKIIFLLILSYELNPVTSDTSITFHYYSHSSTSPNTAMPPNVPAIPRHERERFATILGSARSAALQQWSTRTAARALGWAQYLESKAGSVPLALEDQPLQMMINARRSLLRTMLLSPHLPGPLLGWVKTAYASNGLNDAYARDLAQKEEAEQLLQRRDPSFSTAKEVREAENLVASLLFLHQTVLDKEKRQLWRSGDVSVNEVKVLVRVLVELVEVQETPTDALRGVGSSPVEGLKQAHAAFCALCRDKSTLMEVKAWVVECLVTTCSPTVWWVASDEALRTICRKELGFTLQFYTHLLGRYRVAWRTKNSTDMERCARRCRAVIAAAPWVKSLFHELVGKAKQRCFEDLLRSCQSGPDDIRV